MGVVAALGALAGAAGGLAGGGGGEGGEGGEGVEGRLTGGLTGRGGTGAEKVLAEGVVALAGAPGAAMGIATAGGLGLVGADDAEEVELLGNALPLTAAAATGVAEEEGIEELVEELFEGAAPGNID